jgi:hypothetical protein
MCVLSDAGHIHLRLSKPLQALARFHRTAMVNPKLDAATECSAAKGRGAF